jgi:hypothetical protein
MVTLRQRIIDQGLANTRDAIERGTIPRGWHWQSRCGGPLPALRYRQLRILQPTWTHPSPLITARYFSSSPSDSILRYSLDGHPALRSTASSGSSSALAVSSFRLRARLDVCIPSAFSGQRGFTPAFGYGSPHLSARGTSTLLNNVLLSTHYAAVRLLADVHAGRVAYAFSRRPASHFCRRRLRGLPVLVHEVSRRVWGLRLRRADHELALSRLFMLPSAHYKGVGARIASFRS